MTTPSIQGKLHSIVAEIDQAGHANPTRLTVLKKWLSEPGRLPTLGLWVAAEAASTASLPRDADPSLLELAAGLLGGWRPSSPGPDRVAAKVLHGRLKAFQDQYQPLEWGQARLIKSTSLLLIEEGLEVYLYPSSSPTTGYRLAVDYCKHYDPKYGSDLNGPSRERLIRLVALTEEVERLEARAGWAKPATAGASPQPMARAAAMHA